MEFRVVPVGRGDRPARRPRGAATRGRLASREAAATRPASSGAGSRLWPRGAATPAGQQGGRGDAASKQGRRRAGVPDPDRGCEGRGQGDLDREVG